jgi:hypothetical protein
MEDKLAIECSDLKKLIEDKISEIKNDQKQTSMVIMATQMKQKEFSEIILRVESS